MRSLAEKKEEILYLISALANFPRDDDTCWDDILDALNDIEKHSEACYLAVEEGANDDPF